MNKFKWDDIQIDQEESFEQVIEEEMLASFASISGDQNPLHTDLGFAKDNGHPKRVAHGLLTSALYSRLVGMSLPGKYALLHGIDISFKAPVYPGDNLTVSGKVFHKTDAYKQMEIKASIKNQKGKTVSKALIKVGVSK
ncbi:MAG: acyl dehydratase [Bacteriovoracaceae bacterium]|jgi:acyl dehydratase